MTDSFWATIEAQLTELRDAKSADDVLHILRGERNPYGDPNPNAGGGFFAGSGGEGSVMESLNAAGWSVVWMQAPYYYVIQAPNGDKITYVEGDIYRGDTAIR